jgi:flavin-dependent dehydrogenase
MRIVDDGKSNPIIIMERHDVLDWLRAKADNAGYSDRTGSAVQIVVNTPFSEGTRHHLDVPELAYMVSNIPQAKEGTK